jgi:hypothetical protein
MTNKNSTITAPTYTKIKVIAKNSASNKIQILAAEKKDKIKNSTAFAALINLV